MLVDVVVVCCGQGLAGKHIVLVVRCVADIQIGVLSACELLERLAHDRVIPEIFLRVMPRTGSSHVSIIAFVGLCAALYASTGASLSIVSKMFTLVWLFVMALFPLSLLLLKFNRGRLPRRGPQTSLRVIFCAFVIAFVIMGGNVAMDPTTAG